MVMTKIIFSETRKQRRSLKQFQKESNSKPENMEMAQKYHYKLATLEIIGFGSPLDKASLYTSKNRRCLAGDIFQCRLPGNKVCNFTMSLSSGDPQPIFSNVGFGSPLDTASLFVVLGPYFGCRVPLLVPISLKKKLGPYFYAHRSLQV